MSRRGTRWSAASVVATLALAACSEDDVLLYRYDDRPVTAAGGSAGEGSGGHADRGGASPSGGKSSAGGAGPSSGGAAHAGGSSAGGSPGSGGDPTDSGAPNGPCTSLADCPSGWTCSKTTCFDAVGQCEPRPVLCDPNPVPVCGCDFVTYWNDCVRRQQGTTASSLGQCGFGARACTTSLDCGNPAASCSHLTTGPLQCGPSGPGTCWVTPSDCTGTPSSPRWLRCLSPTPPTPTDPCDDTCTAIRSGDNFIQLLPSSLCQ